MWARKFWLEVFERALKTGAQAVAALLVGDGLGVLDIDWTRVGSIAGLAVVASVMTSIASSGVNRTDTPSLV